MSNPEDAGIWGTSGHMQTADNDTGLPPATTYTVWPWVCPKDYDTWGWPKVWPDIATADDRLTIWTGPAEEAHKMVKITPCENGFLVDVVDGKWCFNDLDDVTKFLAECFPDDDE